jgi:hypothetical protein
MAASVVQPKESSMFTAKAIPAVETRRARPPVL